VKEEGASEGEARYRACADCGGCGCQLFPWFCDLTSSVVFGWNQNAVPTIPYTAINMTPCNQFDSPLFTNVHTINTAMAKQIVSNEEKFKLIGC
jgi:hypothetical protein